MDNMVLLKGARHKELAFAFINYLHTPEVYARIIDYLGYPCINTAARPLLKKRPNYTLADLEKSELKEDLGADLEVYNKIWEKIRMGN